MSRPSTANQPAPSGNASVDLKSLVEPDPIRPGPDRWRLVDHWIAVWAIIQHIIAIGDLDDALDASDATIAEAAADYAIPEIAVRAALAYYADNRGAIDTKIASNAAGASRR